MQKGDNKGALEKFDQAFQLVASPKILFNRGKAHRALGEDLEALADFERFLDEAPYAPKESREEARRTVEALRPKLAYLEIQVEDPGSSITVDGHDVGTAPLPRAIPVVPGTHEISVTKSGMNDDKRSVSPIPGQKLRVVIKLVLVPDTSAASSHPPPSATGTALASGTAAPPAQMVDTSPPAPAAPARGARSWQVPAAWAAAGAGVLFLGAGITAQVMSSSKFDEYNAVTDAPNASGQCAQGLPDSGGGRCQELSDAAHLRRTLAIVGYVAAGVAVAGSIALFATAPSSSSPGGHDVAVACVPSQTSGVSCALSTRF